MTDQATTTPAEDLTRHLSIALAMIADAITDAEQVSTADAAYDGAEGDDIIDHLHAAAQRLRAAAALHQTLAAVPADTPEARTARYVAATYCPDCNCPKVSLAHATNCLSAAPADATASPA
jgi:hypothetical protein